MGFDFIFADVEGCMAASGDGNKYRYSVGFDKKYGDGGGCVRYFFYIYGVEISDGKIQAMVMGYFFLSGAEAAGVAVTTALTATETYNWAVVTFFCRYFD